MIKRIFHSIGQGAFYSERHENYNIVYDCGSLPDTNASKHYVKQSFFPKEVIDILFISHFDADHVNKIAVLANEFKIINVIMPLLFEEGEKLLLINYYKAIGNIDVAALIENPEGFFGENTRIFYVEATESSKPSDEVEIILITDFFRREKIIKSFSKIILNDKVDWQYIPYNYSYSSRNIELHDLLRKNDIDTEKLKSNLSYALAERYVLQEIYKKLKGNINENSMLVYSGPINNDLVMINNHNTIITKRVGCIFSGDANLNRVDIKTAFQEYWKNVGTIQIPHHGDHKCFNDSFFDGREYFCPISFGLGNHWGHPSILVELSIIEKNSFPVFIFNNVDSRFLQIIFSFTL